MIMYSTKTELTKRICNEIQWRFVVTAITTMSRKGKIYVKGTALKPNEARELEQFCKHNNYVYGGPYAY